MADRAPKRRRIDPDSNENDGDLPSSRAALRTAVTKALDDEAALLREVAAMILGELRHLMVEQDQLRAMYAALRGDVPGGGAAAAGARAGPQAAAAPRAATTRPNLSG
ncbi:hypothetical protein AMAG_08398 [Allomyces macrogynus ATCC 38327]|uniref:Uncharacterized protein n=1 Tax=Allomyces macrogynus (strain ATCC 38327) TaxID=578462 RepID=A0A0L0SL07_ALLM3|nr:hypothetical protein AMAG_08398 [Allomyces macrogynus ATCC 38327]|eukprot:KNE63251.1 hypothetical protein AMAG_08398 [Allomyces macrogynus ATCC 38327]